MSLTHTLHPAAADRSGDRLAKRCPKMDPRIDPTWMPERFQVDPRTTPKPCPNDSNTNPEWLRSDSQNTPQLSPICCWHLLSFCISVYAYLCLLILIVGSSWHLLTFPYRVGICWPFCIIVAEFCWFVYGKLFYLDFVTNFFNVAIWQVLKLAYFIHYIILTLYYYLT